MMMNDVVAKHIDDSFVSYYIGLANEDRAEEETMTWEIVPAGVESHWHGDGSGLPHQCSFDGARTA
jgi:hypothetical protein